jgi:hypothetical protein
VLDISAEAEICCPPERVCDVITDFAGQSRLRLLQPILVRQFRAENSRTLSALNAYADTLG